MTEVFQAVLKWATFQMDTRCHPKENRVKEIKTVAILGAGAMGSFYASRFFDAPALFPIFVARDARYERLKTDGVVVNGKHYAIPVVHPDHAAEPVDLVIVAVKDYHLEDAAHDLKKVVAEHTTILSVMNGLDSEEYLSSVYGKDKVLYAIALGIDAVREGNSMTYTNPGKVYFGEAQNPRPSQRSLAVQHAFDRAGIPNEIPPDMIRMLWWKFMINVGINQASAVMRIPYGVFQSSADAQGLMEDLMREVLTLAQKAGVNLTEQDLEDWYGVLGTLSPQGKTSMLQDIEAGRQTEVEMFAGKVVEMGQKYMTPTPVNRTVLRIIKVMEQQRQ